MDNFAMIVGMQPPAYEPPMKSRNKLPASVWIILGLLGIGCCAGVPILGAILLPVFVQGRAAAQKASCMASIRQESLAMLMYASDDNGKLPYAKEWETAAMPYLRRPEHVRCPLVPRSTDASGFAFNSDLSHKPIPKMISPLIFETGDLKRNSFAKYAKTSSPNRHRGRDGSGPFVLGRNVAFTDGSAKFLPDGR
jgi:hypothetical protein